MKNNVYLITGIAFLLLIGMIQHADACSVCFGMTDEHTYKAVNRAILALLGFVGLVLSGAVAFFLHLRKMAKLAAMEEA